MSMSMSLSMRSLIIISCVGQTRRRGQVLHESTGLVAKVGSAKLPRTAARMNVEGEALVTGLLQKVDTVLVCCSSVRW